MIVKLNLTVRQALTIRNALAAGDTLPKGEAIDLHDALVALDLNSICPTCEQRCSPEGYCACSFTREDVR